MKTITHNMATKSVVIDHKMREVPGYADSMMSGVAEIIVFIAEEADEVTKA